MDFQRKIPIERIVNPSDVVIVSINFNEQNFRDCFSKMEFIQGMDYMSWAVDRFNIPTIYTRRRGKASEKQYLLDYRDIKNYNRSAHIAPTSSFDAKFEEDFRKYLPPAKTDFVEAVKEDAFFGSRLADEIRKLGKTTVMLQGFHTETDVLITALQALMNDFYCVVISDVTSTYSERIFFESLEIMAQVVEVIDSRDLEELWGKDQ